MFVSLIVGCLALWRHLSTRTLKTRSIWLARQVSIRAKRPWQRRNDLAWSLQAALVFSVIGTGVWWGARAGVFQLYQDISRYGYAYAVFSLVAIIVLHDAYFYWTHRLMHRPLLMRCMHRVHHRSHSPTPWTAYAFDPLDAAVQALFFPCVLLVLPVHEIVALLWVTHQIIRNALGHSGAEPIPLNWLRGWWGRWFTTTLHHEMHHAHGRGNYGLWFRWWDQLCGTEIPQYAQALEKLCKQIEAADQMNEQSAKVKERPKSVFWMIALAIGWSTYLLSFSENSQAQDSTALTKAALFGDWATQGYGARVRIGPCAGHSDKLCGTIIWLWDPLGKDGKPMLDTQNSDASLRGRPVLGLDIIHGFSTAPAPGQWVNGKIYNPEDGRSYNANIKQRDADTLELEGCVLLFCAKQIWRRVPLTCQPQ